MLLYPTESHFVDVDNSLKKFGGTATFSTLSDQHVISKNKMFESEEWKTMNLHERKKVISLQKEWIQKVSDAKCLALAGKEYKKKKMREA